MCAIHVAIWESGPAREMKKSFLASGPSGMTIPRARQAGGDGGGKNAWQASGAGITRSQVPGCGQRKQAPTSINVANLTPTFLDGLTRAMAALAAQELEDAGGRRRRAVVRGRAGGVCGIVVA